VNLVKLLFEFLIFPGLLYSALLGLLLVGVRRKLKARVQGRVGPPLLQPVYDFLKLLFKESLTPRQASATVYTLAPLVAFAAVLTAVVIIPVGAYTALSFAGDLIVVLYLLALALLMAVVGGSSSGNPYAAISASRSLTMLIVIEIPLAFIVASVALSAGTLSLTEIAAYQRLTAPFIVKLLPTAAAFLFYIMAKLHFNPFTIPNAETEILEGFLLEYSGVRLALFELAHAMETYALISLFLNLFAPIPVLAQGLSGFILGVVVHAVTCILLVVVITLIESTVARIRIDQMVKLYGIYVNGLAIVGLILSIVQGWLAWA